MADVKLTRDMHITHNGTPYDLKKGDVITEAEARLLQLHDLESGDEATRPVGADGKATTREAAGKITPRKGGDR